MYGKKIILDLNYTVLMAGDIFKISDLEVEDTDSVKKIYDEITKKVREDIADTVYDIDDLYRFCIESGGRMTLRPINKPFGQVVKEHIENDHVTVGIVFFAPCQSLRFPILYFFSPPMPS